MRKLLAVPQVLILSLAASSLSAQTIVGAAVPTGLRGPVSNVVTGVPGYAAGQYFDSVARSVAPLPAGIARASYASANEFVGAAPVSLEATATPVSPVAAVVSPMRVRVLAQKLGGSNPAAFESFFDGRASAASAPATHGSDFDDIRVRFDPKPGWLEAELMKDMMRHSWDRQLWPFLRDSMGVSADEVKQLTFQVRNFKADGLYQSARVSVSHPVHGRYGHFDYHLEKSSGKMRLRSHPLQGDNQYRARPQRL